MKVGTIYNFKNKLYVVLRYINSSCIIAAPIINKNNRSKLLKRIDIDNNKYIALNQITLLGIEHLKKEDISLSENVLFLIEENRKVIGY